MSQLDLGGKFVAKLAGLVFGNSAIANGDTPLAALGKLQGQINAMPGSGFNAGSFTIPAYDKTIYPLSEWKPPGNATTLPGVNGMGALTTVGTATARAVTSSNGLTMLQRIGFVSAATAGAMVSAVDSVNPRLFLGAGGGNAGGYIVALRFGISDPATVSGARMFCGLRNTVSAPTNVEPSTLLNCIGVGHGAADTNLKIYHGASTNTVVDLGANFPTTAVSTEGYLLILYAQPDTAGGLNGVGWYVKRLKTGFSASGIAGQSPGQTNPVNLSCFRTNNATALAVGMDIGAYTSQNLAI